MGVVSYLSLFRCPHCPILLPASFLVWNVMFQVCSSPFGTHYKMIGSMLHCKTEIPGANLLAQPSWVMTPVCLLVLSTLCSQTSGRIAISLTLLKPLLFRVEMLPVQDIACALVSFSVVELPVSHIILLSPVLANFLAHMAVMPPEEFFGL